MAKAATATATAAAGSALRTAARWRCSAAEAAVRRITSSAAARIFGRDGSSAGVRRLMRVAKSWNQADGGHGSAREDELRGLPLADLDHARETG